MKRIGGMRIMGSWDSSGFAANSKPLSIDDSIHIKRAPLEKGAARRAGDGSAPQGQDLRSRLRESI